MRNYLFQLPLFAVPDISVSLASGSFKQLCMAYYKALRTFSTASTLKLTGRPCTGAQSVNTEKVPEPEIARKFHADPVKRFVRTSFMAVPPGMERHTKRAAKTKVDLQHTAIL